MSFTWCLQDKEVLTKTLKKIVTDENGLAKALEITSRARERNPMCKQEKATFKMIVNVLSILNTL